MLDFDKTIKSGIKLYKKYKINALKELLHQKIYLFNTPKKEKFFYCFTKFRRLRNIGCVILGKISLKYGYLGIGGFVYPEEGMYKFSMRSYLRNKYDLSKIAEEFKKGGGQKEAASFLITFNELDELTDSNIKIDIIKDLKKVDLQLF